LIVVPDQVAQSRRGSCRTDHTLRLARFSGVRCRILTSAAGVSLVAC
jgi:hypothetical protein